MDYFSIDRTLLIITVILGFIFVNKSDKVWLRLFPYFLLLSLTVEMTGAALAFHSINNILIFNLYAIIDFSFFIYFFRETTVENKKRKWYTALIFLLALLFLLNMFFVQGVFVFNTYPFITGCILLVILGVNYFYRFFDSPIHFDLVKEPSFWISIAVIFYFTVAVTITGILNYIATLPVKTMYLLHYIQYTVNTLYYILFIIALLCRKMRRRSLSRS